VVARFSSVSVAALLVVAFSTSACSFLFVRGAPAIAELPAEAENISCTDSRAAPIWDLVFASLGAAGMATSGYEAMRTVKTTQNNLVANLSLAGTTALAALFTASTIYGFMKTWACREVRQSLDFRAQKPVFSCNSHRQSPAGSPPLRRTGAVDRLHQGRGLQRRQSLFGWKVRRAVCWATAAERPEP